MRVFRLLCQCGWAVHSRRLETAQWTILSGRNVQELSKLGTFRTLNVSPYATSKSRELVIQWCGITSQKKGCLKWMLPQKWWSAHKMESEVSMAILNEWKKKGWDYSKVCWNGNLRGRGGSEEVEKWGQEEEEEAVFSGELRINFAVGGKLRHARDSLEEKTTVRVLRWQLKLTVKSASTLPVGEVKKIQQILRRLYFPTKSQAQRISTFPFSAVRTEWHNIWR
jgi:hypothetical protein